MIKMDIRKDSYPSLHLRVYMYLKIRKLILAFYVPLLQLYILNLAKLTCRLDFGLLHLRMIGLVWLKLDHLFDVLAAKDMSILTSNLMDCIGRQLATSVALDLPLKKASIKIIFKVHR